MTLENLEQTEDTGTAGTPDAGTDEQPSGTQAAGDQSQVETPNVEDLIAKLPDDKLQELVASRFGDRLTEFEPVKRAIQSAKDKEIARDRADRLARERRQAEDDKRSKSQQERQALIEAEDYEGLGKLEAQQLREQARLKEAASEYNTLVQGALRQHPEFKDLGEETFERVYDEVATRGGSVVDLMAGLTREFANRHSAGEVEKATKSIREEFKSEMEALKTQLGVKTRGDEPGASVTVSGGGAPKQVTKDLKWEQATDLYNSGEMPWDEYKPIDEAHQKERQR